MDFETKRKQLLDQAKKFKQTAHVKERASRQAFIKSTQTQQAATQTKPQNERKEIGLFASGLFVSNLKGILAAVHNVTVFSTTTSAIDGCAEQNIPTLLIDLDEPIGFKAALEVITNLKTICPDMTFIAFTATPTSEHATIMKQRGVSVEEKPVDSKNLFKQL